MDRRTGVWLRWLLGLSIIHTSGALKWNNLRYGVDLPDTEPLPPPDYMVDNTRNAYGVAPDKGTLNVPVLDDNIVLAQQGPKVDGVLSDIETVTHRHMPGKPVTAVSGDYWLPGQKHGSMPFNPDKSYVFYRDVTAYGAKGDGVTDDTAAINRAIVDGSRCGLPTNCSSSTVLGALVYFPPGTYRITTPIVQYYYTQFVGDPLNRPILKGDSNFKGIAMVDSDPYIPGGNGAQWYINQNQFFRQIRNIIFDMTAMPNAINDNGQAYVPTGLHWQAAQATSLQNLDFIMPLGGGTTAVGIFMENGSGGFVSDLYFYGGNIGFRAGSQQYTFHGLRFQSCAIAISLFWNWGMTWQDITVSATYIALDTTSYAGGNGQGTGSIAIVDSYFEYVPYAITLAAGHIVPTILLDNLKTYKCASIVLNSGANTILAGNADGDFNINQWGLGNSFTSLSGTGGFNSGYLSPINQRPSTLLNSSGSYFTRSKPQYSSGFNIVNVNDKGIQGDGVTDQTNAINKLLASNVGSVIFFPAGVYLALDTILIPVGSLIVGEGWSQIMGSGPNFAVESKPHVMVQVGRPGDSGVLEISDMLFTVSGATAGAILMEWNVHEGGQGSVGMWDSHFRVGGATGTSLGLAQCPPTHNSINRGCTAASLIMHVTSQASGYFENVWAWVADHDIDAPLPPGAADTTATQVSIYVGRGILIESQGPTWFYGSASEHSVLYQYQLAGAKDVFLGHMQTETPYFQPNPDARQPYTIGQFTQDPDYSQCASKPSCEESWALRILNSTNAYIYSAGFYSFFNSYDQVCLANESCQDNLVDIGFSQGLWIYNLFTKGAVFPVTPEGGIPPLKQIDVQSGFTTEINAYIPFALQGGEIGGRHNKAH